MHHQRAGWPLGRADGGDGLDMRHEHEHARHDIKHEVAPHRKTAHAQDAEQKIHHQHHQQGLDDRDQQPVDGIVVRFSQVADGDVKDQFRRLIGGAQRRLLQRLVAEHGASFGRPASVAAKPCRSVDVKG